MSDTVGIGDILLWNGGCILIGRAVGQNPLHDHYAIQIAFGTKPGIRFRTGAREAWAEYDAVIIPSRQPHMMDATGVEFSAVLLIEPETPQGRALSERYRGAGITAVAGEALGGTDRALFETWFAGRDQARTIGAAQEVVRAMSGGVGAVMVSDERILRAITYIQSHLGGPLTLEDVAREACLSPSRFRHLFVEQTGTTMRPYVLWRRFLHAWEVVGRGGSLSAAAHSAGFADAAHLTRTSHRMFGFAPSALQVGVRSAPPVPGARP